MGLWPMRKLPQLPPDHRDESDDTDHGEEGDEVRGEPVIFLAFIHDELERAEGEAEQAEAKEIELDAALLRFRDLLLDVWRIFDDARREEKRDDADGDVEEEDPAPVEAVGDVAAECWADCGCADDCQAIHREGLSALGWRKGIGEDGLFGGREAAAADSLQDPAKDKNGQRWREAAQGGADAEERDADHVELLASDEGGHVGAGREDDGVGDKIRGEHPGGFVLRCAEASRDVGQGDVGDGGVKHLHEGGEGDRHGDDPWIDAGPPWPLYGVVGGGLVRYLSAGEFECGSCHAMLIRL